MNKVKYLIRKTSKKSNSYKQYNVNYITDIAVPDNNYFYSGNSYTIYKLFDSKNIVPKLLDYGYTCTIDDLYLDITKFKQMSRDYIVLTSKYKDLEYDTKVVKYTSQNTITKSFFKISKEMAFDEEKAIENAKYVNSIIKDYNNDKGEGWVRVNIQMETGLKSSEDHSMRLSIVDWCYDNQYTSTICHSCGKTVKLISKDPEELEDYMSIIKLYGYKKINVSLVYDQNKYVTNVIDPDLEQYIYDNLRE